MSLNFKSRSWGDLKSVWQPGNNGDNRLQLLFTNPKKIPMVKKKKKPKHEK